MGARCVPTNNVDVILQLLRSGPANKQIFYSEFGPTEEVEEQAGDLIVNASWSSLFSMSPL